jgi:hypothetical protein
MLQRFPSVAHAYLFMCLHAAEFPIGFIWFFEAIYSSNEMFINFEGIIVFLCNVEAGVLQGRPGSGSLFLVAVQPCLIALAQVLRDDEIVRAFADDIAAVIRHLDSLARLFRVFALVEAASKLAINIEKTFFPSGRGMVRWAAGAGCA